MEDLRQGLSIDEIVANISSMHRELEENNIELILLSCFDDPQKRSVYQTEILNDTLSAWSSEENVSFVDLTGILSSSLAFDENFIIVPEYQTRIKRKIKTIITEKTLAKDGIDKN
jgi:hypothetical protein